MILTCPQCQSQYSLDAEKLGAGRVVRCVSCSHTWFQAPETQVAAETPPPPPPPEPPIQPAQQTAGQDWNLEEHAAATAPTPEAEQQEIFEAIMTSVSTRKSSARQAPGKDVSAAVITHNPLGVGAGMFGFLTFLFCVSLTMLVLFLGQKPIVGHWPQMAILYQKVGVRLKAPGEGLKLSALIAEQRTEDKKRILAIQGKITNMSKADMLSPPLHVTVKDEQRRLLKEWDLVAGASTLASGQESPLKLEISDVPPGGAIVEMRVQGH